MEATPAPGERAVAGCRMVMVDGYRNDDPTAAQAGPDAGTEVGVPTLRIVCAPTLELRLAAGSGAADPLISVRLGWTAPAGRRFAVWTSTDRHNWDELPGTVEGEAGELERYRTTVRVTPAPLRYFRLTWLAEAWERPVRRRGAGVRVSAAGR